MFEKGQHLQVKTVCPCYDGERHAGDGRGQVHEGSKRNSRYVHTSFETTMEVVDREFDHAIPQLRGRLYEKTYKVDMGGNFPTLNTRSTSLVIFDLKSFHKSANGLFISNIGPPIVCSCLIITFALVIKCYYIARLINSISF